MKRIFLVLGLLFVTAGSVSAQQDAPPTLNPNEIMKLMSQEGGLDDAIKLVGDAEAEGKRVPWVVRQQLAMNLLQKTRNDEAIAQIQKVMEPAFAQVASKQDASELSNVLMSCDRTLRRAGKKEIADKWLADSLTAVKGLLDDKGFTKSDLPYIRMLQVQAGLSLEEDKTAEADQVIHGAVLRNEKIFEAAEKTPENMQIMLGTWADSIPFLTEAHREHVFSNISGIAKDFIAKQPTDVLLNQYLAATRQYVFSVADEKIDAADAAITSAQELFQAVKENNENMAGSVERLSKSLDQISKSVESSRRLLALVNSPAPALDAMLWVNGEAIEPDALKGKVVLLDFWAVWCGPCIATFPHLRHLHDEYGSKGLQIIGATRMYNYAWDEEQDKAVRSKEEVSQEDEVVMLNKFMAKHELRHPSLVSPKASTMQADFGVSGIPHAVVIDKQGIVRLIKVGSGAKNAEAIEKKIKELLGS